MPTPSPGVARAEAGRYSTPFDSISDARRALDEGSLTSVELVERCLDNARMHDPEVGIFTQLFDETALADAELLDREREAGRSRGGLHGIPLGIKDIIRTKDGPTTAQSTAMDPAWGEVRRDAAVVARLRSAGGLILGKTTTSEFAMGMPDPLMPYPIPRNPWNLQRYAGGSSSGSASGLVAGAFLGSVGTDTGGSIRIPAAFCGVTGLKTSFGHVPVDGVFPLAFSLDTVGPMARTAADCRLLFGVMSQNAPSTESSPGRAVREQSLDGLRGIRVGVERDHHLRDPMATTAAIVSTNGAADILSSNGAECSEVSIPRLAELEAASMLICMAEGAAVHAPSLHERWELYGQSLKSGLLAGISTTAVEYLQAKRACVRGHHELAAVFSRVDVILLPTVLRGAVAVDAPLSDLIQSIKVTAWNGLGYPVLNVPAGFDDDGLPLGISIVGQPGAEDLILRVGEVFQEHTPWHLMSPGVTND